MYACLHVCWLGKCGLCHPAEFALDFCIHMCSVSTYFFFLPVRPHHQHLLSSQSTLPSLMIVICKHEHIVLLHKMPVNAYFPSVSKIIQLANLPGLISCLWDHKNQNLLVGDSLGHTMHFIEACISVSCVKLTVIMEPFLISIHSSYHCPY